MTVMLQDTQKFIGVNVRGRPVIGHCRSDGWRDRVVAFLGRPLPPEATGHRTTGVSIPWLRQNFAQCSANANQETVTYYCRAWVLHLFGCVLFPDATGDTASWMYLPYLDLLLFPHLGILRLHITSINNLFKNLVMK
jgi:hypothetical protein